MPGADQGADCRVRLHMGEQGGPSEVQDSRGMRAWPRASGKEEAEGETLERGPSCSLQQKKSPHSNEHPA